MAGADFPASWPGVEFSAKDFRSHLLPILLGQAFGLGMGVIGVQLASHWVAPADYGAYGLFVSLTPLGLGVVHIGLLKHVARHWQESRDRDALLRGVLASSVKKLPWVGLGAALAAGLIPGAWAWNFAALFVSATALIAVALVQAALQAERRNWRDLAVGCTASLLRTGAPIACYLLLSASAGALLAGFALQAMFAAVLVAGIAGWLALPWRGTAAAVPPTFEGRRFTVLAVVGWGMGASGRWIATEFFGAEEAGYFVLAGNIALVAVATLYAVVQQFFQPRLFALPAATDEDMRRLMRTADWLAAGFVAAAAVGIALLTFLMPWLVGTIVGPRYAAAAAWVPAAGGYHVAVLVPAFFHLMLLAGKRDAKCGPAEISAALVVLLGGLLAASAGIEAFRWFASASPLLAWIVARPIARRAMLQAR